MSVFSSTFDLSQAHSCAGLSAADHAGPGEPHRAALRNHDRAARWRRAVRRALRQRGLGAAVGDESGGVAWKDAGRCFKGRGASAPFTYIYYIGWPPT